jgi:hypothetical protein
MTVTGRRSAATPAAFCAGVDGGDARGTEGPAGGEEFRAAIASRSLADARQLSREFFEIVGVQAKQNDSDDRVLAKGGFILAQTEIPEPNPDIHGRLHLGNWDIARTALCKDRNNGFGHKQRSELLGATCAFDRRLLSLRFPGSKGSI